LLFRQKSRIDLLKIPGGIAMKSPQLDMRAWIERARQFAEHLQQLGVQFEELTFSSAPPLDANKLTRSTSTAPNPIPVSLRRFFEEGAGELELHYIWDPVPAQRLAVFRKILPGMNPNGGAVFGPASRLVEYQADCRDFAMEDWPSDDPEAQQQWLRAVPFLRMPSAEYLALDPGLDQTNPPVIWLPHFGDTHIVSPNFASFLLEWERLCYVGPDMFMIEPFIDPVSRCPKSEPIKPHRGQLPIRSLPSTGVSGYLNSETAKAQALRDVFGNPFRPVSIESSWRTSSVLALATAIASDHDYARLPVLADALEDAGCTDHRILDHCRREKGHVRSCWVVELVTGKSRRRARRRRS
jgi:hypothetical protein